MGQVSRCQPLLGTYVDVSLAGNLSEPELHQLCHRAYARVREVERLMSFHDPDSELSIVNKSAVGEEIIVSPQTYKVLEFSQKLHAQSDGLFDPCIASQLVGKRLLPSPKRFTLRPRGSIADLELDAGRLTVKKHQKLWIDLGGIAKGFAVDQAFDFLTSQNCLDHVSVNAGGDMRMTPYSDQQIYLRPHLAARFNGGDVGMLREACATSTVGGTHQQATSFVVDPLKNQCISKSAMVSVFAHSAMQADAFTKICLLVAGEQQINTLMNLYDATYLTHD